MRSRDDIWEEIRECDRQIESLGKQATKQALIYSAVGIAWSMTMLANDLDGQTVAGWFVVGIPVLTFVLKNFLFQLFPRWDSSTYSKNLWEDRKAELLEELSE
jgi:hypothetical protein